MKVAYQIAANFGGTGLGYVSYQAARGLQESGWLASVTCTQHEPTDIAEDLIFDVPGVDWFSRMMPRRIANRYGIDSLVRQNLFGYMASRRIQSCDLVHGFTGQMLETIKAAKSAGVKTFVDRPNTHVKFIRTILQQEYEKNEIPYSPYTNAQILREVEELELCDAVITCSEFARQTMIAEGVKENKIHVVPYGVDTDVFRPETKTDSIFRVVFVGMICLRKGVQYLLRAWHDLQLENAELILQGHLLDDAVRLLEEYRGKCRFTIRPYTGNMTDLCRLYNTASVCVFPSLEDGYGMVVNEALACERPVIITDHMGAADLVVNGIDGFTVPAGNADALKEKLLFFYHHTDTSMGSSGRERIRRFTWDNYRSKLMAAYQCPGGIESCGT